MNVETLINNDEYKMIFLKAILLGIKYGKSDNSDFYIDNIKNEISKIYYKLNRPEIIKYNNIIKKNEMLLINLEYQKGNILSNIQKLSHNNYSSNHSKINILKITLQNIQVEIEKIKVTIKKTKDLKDKLNSNNFDNLGNSYTYPQQSNMVPNTNTYSNTYTNHKTSSNNHHTTQNTHTQSSINKNSGLVGELEKTLDNLSNLFI